MKSKRQYSRAFTARDGKGKQYNLTGIPAAFWLKVQRKAKREGVSIRALVLGWLADWIATEPDEELGEAASAAAVEREIHERLAEIERLRTELGARYLKVECGRCSGRGMHRVREDMGGKTVHVERVCGMCGGRGFMWVTPQQAASAVEKPLGEVQR